jgi:glycosyltransferase involved in cell wall biosynthesis
MRVLLTADAVSGVWRYAIDLASWLAARGVKIALATMGPPPSAAQRTEARMIRGLELHESAWRLEWMDDPWADVDHAGEWLLDVARRTRPDVVHLNGYVHAALPWRVPVAIVAHSCVESWWRAVRDEPAPGRFERYRAEVRRGLDAANVVIAPTDAMLRALADAYGPVDGRVIPRGVRTVLYEPAAKAQIVFSAGRLSDPANNLDALRAIGPRVAWPIVVADPQERSVVEASPDEPNGVCVLGALAQGEIARWLAHAAIFALPAVYEPFGLSVLEAALSGCSLVLSDIPSLRENWEGTALFVDPRDRDALVRAISRLAWDAPARARLAAAARARGASFTRDRMGAAYLSVYGELAPARQGVHA